MEMINWSGKKVALLGYGLENRALLPFFRKERLQSLTICDRNLDLPQDQHEVHYRLGDDYLKNLTDFDILVRTPGIPYRTPAIQEALRSGVVVTSQTKIFMALCPATVIGITGTKGKSTTAALTSHILRQAEAAGHIAGHIYLAGNIGTPPITFLDKLSKDDWVVAEFSSFQLQDLTKSPEIAVILNTTVDHLDHHQDEAEYVSAKKNIVRYQEQGNYVVINLDSITSVLFADETPATAYFYSRQKSVDMGVFVERRAGDDGLILRLPSQESQEICLTREIKLVGPYNLENVCAAATAAALVPGVTLNDLRSGITSFTGLPHRLQLVAEKNGIRFYDDSKSTTPDSTIAAILSFDEPLVLIAGGSSKGADFTELAKQIMASRVNSVICIGEEGRKLREILLASGAKQTILEGKATMPAIVEAAYRQATAGSVVLLSPAAASFDMFKNAEDRGDQFQQAVMQLD